MEIQARMEQALVDEAVQMGRRMTLEEAIDLSLGIDS
jgi:hypothetical protein